MYLNEPIKKNYAQGFATSMYTKKGRQPYLYQVYSFAAPTFSQTWAKLKILDFGINQLQRDKG